MWLFRKRSVINITPVYVKVTLGAFNHWQYEFLQFGHKVIPLLFSGVNKAN